MTLYPGDPLTPGVGATKDAKRLKISEAPTILKIPVLPISYADAQVFLAALGGRVAPPDMARRAADHLSRRARPGGRPSGRQVRLEPQADLRRHRDHEGFDAVPTSGSCAAITTTAGCSAPATRCRARSRCWPRRRPIGGLVQQGWRPKRTIVYTSWDGEEPMLVGSTEWAETHADELKKKAVLYINSDTNGRGFLRVGGSHDFQHLVNEVAADVIDPETGVPIGQRLRAKMRIDCARARRHRARQGRGQDRGRSRTRISLSRRWVRAPTFQPFSTTWACPRWTWFRRRGRHQRRLPLPLRHLRAP